MSRQFGGIPKAISEYLADTRPFFSRERFRALVLDSGNIRLAEKIAEPENLVSTGFACLKCQEFLAQQYSAFFAKPNIIPIYSLMRSPESVVLNGEQYVLWDDMFVDLLIKYIDLVSKVSTPAFGNELEAFFLYLGAERALLIGDYQYTAGSLGAFSEIPKPTSLRWPSMIPQFVTLLGFEQSSPGSDVVSVSAAEYTFYHELAHHYLRENPNDEVFGSREWIETIRFDMQRVNFWKDWTNERVEIYKRLYGIDRGRFCPELAKAAYDPHAEIVGEEHYKQHLNALFENPLFREEIASDIIATQILFADRRGLDSDYDLISAVYLISQVTQMLREIDSYLGAMQARPLCRSGAETAVASGPEALVMDNIIRNVIRWQVIGGVHFLHQTKNGKRDTEKAVREWAIMMPIIRDRTDQILYVRLAVKAMLSEMSYLQTIRGYQVHTAPDFWRFSAAEKQQLLLTKMGWSKEQNFSL